MNGEQGWIVHFQNIPLNKMWPGWLHYGLIKWSINTQRMEFFLKEPTPFIPSHGPLTAEVQPLLPTFSLLMPSKVYNI